MCTFFLFQQDADIDVTDGTGQSAVFYAVKRGTEQPLRYLIEHSANQSILNIRGNIQSSVLF